MRRRATHKKKHVTSVKTTTTTKKLWNDADHLVCVREKSPARAFSPIPIAAFFSRGNKRADARARVIVADKRRQNATQITIAKKRARLREKSPFQCPRRSSESRARTRTIIFVPSLERTSCGLIDHKHRCNDMSVFFFLLNHSSTDLFLPY